MNIRVIHGPNLNMLGLRETSIYGASSLDDVNARLVAVASDFHSQIECLQSNLEGEIVSWIQECHASMSEENQVDGLLLNLGAYTHTSIAIRDALLAADIPCVEVHMSNVFAREPFRHHSMISDISVGVISGFGVNSYILGFKALLEHLSTHT